MRELKTIFCYQSVNPRKEGRYNVIVFACQSQAISSRRNLFTNTVPCYLLMFFIYLLLRVTCHVLRLMQLRRSL